MNTNAWRQANNYKQSVLRNFFNIATKIYVLRQQADLNQSARYGVNNKLPYPAVPFQKTPF